MSSPVVEFSGVWKKFRRGERHSSLRDLLPAAVSSALLRSKRPSDDAQAFWALQDVSFSVDAGHALGIIGRNGAGKSTTLKLLTRILKPTRGSCHVRGRVGALIEVAAGFHPDLTGRENIFLQGAIMGMTRSEIGRKLDQIVDFAGVGEFIDTPVKRYSSGMNARLGFSIAAHLEPDVMIIDEILSVGDSAFQDRCVRRMEEFKKAGVAIVFVSHNLQAVSSLCDTALLLQQRTLAYGPTDDVLRHYIEATDSATDAAAVHSVRFAAPRLSTVSGEPVETVTPGDQLQLRVDCIVDSPISDLTFVFILHRATDHLRVYDGMCMDVEAGRTTFRAGDRFTVVFEFSAHLTRGHYLISCEVHHNPTYECLTVLSPAAMFTVSESRTRSGIADVELRVSCPSEEAVEVPEVAQGRV